MTTIFQKHVILEKLTPFVDWLTGNDPDTVSTQTGVDDLQAEIYKLEKTLANLTQPCLRTTCTSSPLEPVSERQKIMDLAG